MSADNEYYREYRRLERSYKKGEINIDQFGFFYTSLQFQLTRLMRGATLYIVYIKVAPYKMRTLGFIQDFFRLKLILIATFFIRTPATLSIA